MFSVCGKKHAVDAFEHRISRFHRKAFQTLASRKGRCSDLRQRFGNGKRGQIAVGECRTFNRRNAFGKRYPAKIMTTEEHTVRNRFHACRKRCLSQGIAQRKAAGAYGMNAVG